MTNTHLHHPIRLMLVDDSAVIRGVFKRVLASEQDINVVCTASNGEVAINNLDRYDIEVIILDIEMPIMDGLTALPLLMKKKPDLQIIMASTLTRRNAEVSIRALSKGAKDYVPKPDSAHELEEESFQRELLSKIRTLAATKRKKAGEPLPLAEKKVVYAAEKKAAERKENTVPKPKFTPDQKTPYKLRSGSLQPADIITIGSSTGGPQALSAVLKNFPKDIKQPILITQHMPATFTAILAEHLSKDCDIKCAEAKDGDILKPQHVYVAPGGLHMTLVNENNQKIIRLTKEPPENFCRPSVDPMLRSVADLYGPRALTIILTGMGSDGLKGAEIIAEKGGTIIAQDEESSVVWGMPGAVSQAGLCTEILPLAEISNKIKRYIG